MKCRISKLAVEDTIGIYDLGFVNRSEQRTGVGAPIGLRMGRKLDRPELVSSFIIPE